MATQRAALEPSVRSFDATVTEVTDGAIELDQTYFYAASGGQPADRGVIEGVSVEDVYLDNGTVYHRLVDTEALSPGDVVSCEIDDTFRRYAMCAHTASHAVYGAARQRYDSVGYGGFEITPTKVRIDLETPEPIDDDGLIALERLTNQVIWEDRPVTWDSWPTDRVRQRDDIALNVATEVIETEDVVRIVQIDDWDIAACGGTHVDSTGKIGAVALTDRSNPGEGQTRVEFVVGQARIDQHIGEKRAAWTAKTEFGTPIEALPERLAQITADQQASEDRMADLETALIEARLSSRGAIRFERDGVVWNLTTVDQVDASTVTEALGAFVGDLGDVLVVAGGNARSHLVVATDGTVAATDVVDAALDGFEGGGGGGSETSAQAGGIDTSPPALIEYVRDEFADT